MKERSDATWAAVAFVCDDGMSIVSVKGIGEASSWGLGDLAGRKLADIVEGPSMPFLRELEQNLGRGRTVSNIQLVLRLGSMSKVMQFFGSRAGSHYVLVAGPTVEDAVMLLEDRSLRDDPFLASGLPTLLSSLLSAPSTSGTGVEVLDELSRLNNEIVNYGRELAKRNFELHLEKERERVTIASIGDAVVVTDTELRVTNMNGLAQRLTGWSMEEAHLRNVGEIVHFEDADGKDLVEGGFASVLTARAPRGLPMDAWLLSRNGVKRAVDDSMSPIIDEQGVLLGLIIVFKDITERKRMEQSLLDTNDSIRLINKTMRHDIMNELTVTSGGLDLYRMKGSDRALVLAENAIVRAIKLIENMKALESGLLSGRSFSVYDVREVAAKVLDTFDVPSTIEGPSAAIEADEALPSVLENIVRNAIVHGRTDRLRVEISIQGDRCQVSIMDWGSGIPEEVRSRIFEEGFKFGSTGGTGLGLYIVWKVMKRYGGAVTVRENRPNGTIFDLVFSLYRPSDPR